MTRLPAYPSVRYYREPDGRIGCWTIHSPAEEQPDWYDTPVKVPELGPGEAEAPAVTLPPVTDAERPASPAPSRRPRWWRAHEGARDA